MTVPSKTSGVAASAVACVLSGALGAACAGATSPDGAADHPVVARVMVQLVGAAEDSAAIAADATRVAGVPVRYAAAASARWHAVALHCASAAECDAAIARLRSATSLYQAVEIEGRKSRSAS